MCEFQFYKQFLTVHASTRKGKLARIIKQPTLGRVVRGASCPWCELSVGRTVRGANCPWGELSMGRTVHGASCPWGELSMGQSVHGASCYGASCRGASFDEASCRGASGPGTHPNIQVVPSSLFLFFYCTKESEITMFLDENEMLSS